MLWPHTWASVHQRERQLPACAATNSLFAGLWIPKAGWTSASLELNCGLMTAHYGRMVSSLLLGIGPSAAVIELQRRWAKASGGSGGAAI
jgi:hypothetical protein